MALLCFALHFVFYFGLLSLFFYTVYLLPACMLVVMGAAGNLNCSKEYTKSAGLISISALLISIWIISGNFADLISLNNRQTFLLAVALVLVGIAGNAVHIFSPLVAMVLLTILLVSQHRIEVVGIGEEVYNIRNSSFERSEIEREVYEGSISFQQWVAAAAPVGSDLVFWYPADSVAAPLNSVQSMYLWAYSRLTFQPYPEITTEVKGAIMSREFLCLIALDDDGLADGLDSIVSQEIEFEEVSRFVFKGQSWGFRSIMIRIERIS